MSAKIKWDDNGVIYTLSAFKKQRKTDFLLTVDYNTEIFFAVPNEHLESFLKQLTDN